MENKQSVIVVKMILLRRDANPGLSI